MKKLLSLLALPAVLLAPACSNDGDIFGPSLRGTGPTQSEVRTLSTFERLELKIDAEVIVSQGSPQQVRVEAQRNILDVLETEMNGDKLEVEYGRVNVRGHDPIRIYITVPTLRELEVSGSGKASSATPFTATNFQASVSGSGELNLNFAQVDALRTTVSGSGEAKMSGNAPSHNVNISGSGRVSAYDLTTLDTYVGISGSGRSYVRAARTLNADITGSGSVYYKGNPTVSSRIAGSGRVLADN
ncbi:head GIN domain-containing protein [Hymenobacter arizonensis]|uniref:Putative auto-transporter adhesin, head GIN domain n=1 Tax=Hymenobacter arizonensis TaxID=1227077 RepID=A0A1I6BQR9_HYMAR|nr:head GIN domain-containing protein [Hymenobacter arizonensis]SFQ83207.1 Putative auto-transporter adhesin, head GIN domain [Hymenobacter arizonensis]